LFIVSDDETNFDSLLFPVLLQENVRNKEMRLNNMIIFLVIGMFLMDPRRGATYHAAGTSLTYILLYVKKFLLTSLIKIRRSISRHYYHNPAVQRICQQRGSENPLFAGEIPVVSPCRNVDRVINSPLRLRQCAFRLNLIPFGYRPLYKKGETSLSLPSVLPDRIRGEINARHNRIKESGIEQ
jgi:hypothetical protein